MTDEHERLSQDVAAYALGGLDPPEQVAFEAHLRGCVRCARLLVEYRAVMDLVPLSLVAQSPPPEARAALLAQVRREQIPPVPPSSLGQRLAALIGPVARVAIVALVAGLLVWNVQLQQQVMSFQAAADIDRRARLTDSRAIALVGTGAPAASARLYVVGDGSQAELAVTGLPPVRADRTYQLWFARPGQLTETGGAFRVNERGQALATMVIPVPLDQVSAIAVTEEPMPASMRPTGEHLLDWKP